MTAPIILAAMDDVSPNTGVVSYGGYTNDTSPVIRVTLGDQLAPGDTIALTDNGAAVGQTITLTAAEIAQGYADVPLSGLSEGWNLISATARATDGSVIATTPAFALGVATATPATPTISGADDDSGGALHAIVNGGHTGDATPILHIFEPGLPAPPPNPPGHPPYGGPPLLGGHILIYEGQTVVGEGTIGYNGTLDITADALAPGDHVLTAVAVDRAGNVSAPSAPFEVVVDAPAAEQAAGSGTPSDGDDLLQAGAGFLSVEGGLGADTIVGAASSDTLHGGPGNDSITGGAQFNAINGNTGDDTIIGRSPVGDWLLGGQGADSINAEQSTGHNIINGNLGNDVLRGGSGGDTLRGGQGDDVVVGGAGADWLFGDLGHNTLTGGGGADTFHALSGPSVDLVTDFNPAEGDRIVVDPGVVFTAEQVGTDTVVHVGDQGEMILANVKLENLPAGWIMHL
jgi:Ca2+-binding RTX toxin-like protein